MTTTKSKVPKPNRNTWLEIVTQLCLHPTALWEIQALAKRNPRANGRRNVAAKVSQVLYTHPDRFFEFSPGVWALVEFFAPEEVKACRASRMKRLKQRQDRKQ